MYECVQLLCCLIDVFFFGKLLDVSLSENLRNIFLTKIPARPRLFVSMTSVKFRQRRLCFETNTREDIHLFCFWSHFF
jgi:hypothetical protein